MNDYKTILSKMAIWIWLVLAILLILYFLSGIYIIDSDEQGVVVRFGKVIKFGETSGIHYHLPLLIERVYKIKVTARYKEGIGFSLLEEAETEDITYDENVEWLTGDTNILKIKAIVNYSIKDPAKYLFISEDARDLLKRTGETITTEVLGGMPVDDVLTTGRQELQIEVKKKLQDMLDTYECGIIIFSINLVSIEPPAQVLPAFQDVSNAKADMQKLKNEANGYTSQLLPQAEGQANSMISAATGIAESRVARAEGDVARFNLIYDEYRKAPRITSYRLYLETMEKILPNMQKYIIDKQSGNLMMIEQK